MKQLTAFILLLLPAVLSAQKTFTKDMLYGEWKIVKRDVDTGIVSRVKTGEEILPESPGIHAFNKNGKWVISANTNKRPFVRHYKIYEKERMIVTGRLRKPVRDNVYRILYIDDEYMVMVFPNPKTEVPCLLKKQKSY